MARIPEDEINRMKSDVSLRKLVECHWGQNTDSTNILYKNNTRLYLLSIKS